MRKVVEIPCVLILLCGCASHPASSPKLDTAKASPDKTEITADFRPTGKVAMVNQVARFVVINFDLGQAPEIGRTLNVYRNGAKVGEVKVTGPQQDNNTVADIVIGDVQVNDETREN